MPDRLVTQHIGICRIDDHADPAQRAALGLLLRRRLAADEIVLGEIDEAVEPGLEDTVDGPELAIPGGEVLLQPHGEQRPHAEVHDAEVAAAAAAMIS